jgi:hypothetical protein
LNGLILLDDGHGGASDITHMESATHVEARGYKGKKGALEHALKKMAAALKAINLLG